LKHKNFIGCRDARQPEGKGIMLYAFKTKRDTNGNRKILAIFDAEKIYTRENNFFSTFDFVEIKSKDRNNLIKDLDDAGFSCVDCNTFRKITGF
jgi:hypothetical protein